MKTGPTPARRLLVVDDDDDFRARLRRPLKAAGYSVEEAVSFGQALGWLGREHFDLAVVDLRLKRPSGPGAYDGDHLLRDLLVSGTLAIIVSQYVGGPDAQRLRMETHPAVLFEIVDKREFRRPGFLSRHFLATVARALEAADDVRESEGLTASQQTRLRALGRARPTYP